MSIVNITHHDENIFKVETYEDVEPLPPKPEKYRSKFRKSLLEQVQDDHPKTCCARKKNCCEHHAIVPKQKQQKELKNTLKCEKPSELNKVTISKFPIYIHNKEKFGKIPTYLVKMKKKALKAKEMNDQHECTSREDDDDKCTERFSYISSEEREKLLKGLQHNWHLMQQEYQRMPLLIDTVPKVLRKTKLEKELKSIEKDICLLKTDSRGSKLDVFVKFERK